MKIQHFLEIIIVFLLVFPPLFVEPQSYTFSGYNWISICLQLILSILIFFRVCKFTEIKLFSCFNLKTILFLILLFLILIANALFWNFIANKTGFANTASLNQKINIPFVMNILVGTFVAAFYEEIVYRVYLPSYTLSIINKVNLSEKLQKNIQYFFEVLIVILFAISHSYAGLPAVMNAFFAGIVLRLYIIKKMGIIFITIVHFLYNLLWLIKIF